MKKNIGIYIHIPFCVRKCAYCDFLSAPAQEAVRERYVEVLKREIYAAKALGAAYRAATVFFGGGTPSLLKGQAIAEILEAVRKVFGMVPDAEITVECNPGTLNWEKLENYREAGVTRLSLGLQSARNEELKLLGRIHTWEDFQESYELARAAGFSNLNVDLMSALPGQSRETWLDTLKRVTALEPEHISAYSLIIEEGTPFYEQYREGGPREAELPDEDTERQMYHDTKEFLQKYGYERYEISNYAKPGYACRHNLTYWERTPYKGFGIGAASLVNEVRSRNSASMEDYLAGSFRPENEERLTHKEQLEETMFLGLRKMEGVELTEELSRVYREVFRELEEEGLLLCEGRRVRLTDRGVDVSNYAFAKFLFD